MRVGQQSDLDFTLAVGQRTETVSVTAAPPLLNTVSAALGTEVSEQYLTNLPLHDRSISNLAYLAPGITEVSGSNIDATGGTNFASNGQRYATSEFRLDGSLITTPEGGEGGSTNGRYMPSVEALQEFTLQNNSFSAEYGNNGGTVVNIITKSGTNAFHGSGWYFYRRPSLDANDFFSNAAGGAATGNGRGAYKHDQGGFSIGGPVIKNKTFFFFDYEKTRDDSANPILTSVPTAAERLGDFSALCQTGFDTNGVCKPSTNPNSPLPQIQLYNPLTCGGTPAGQDCQRQPFKGNIVTTQDPVGQKVLGLFPMPNQPGDAFGHFNFAAKLIFPSPWYQFDARIDHNFSQSSRLNGRYSQGNGQSPQPDPFFLESALYENHTHNFVLEHNWSASPNTLWVNRISIMRQNNPQTTSSATNPESVGFSPTLVDNTYFHEVHFPSVNFDDGYQSLGNTTGCCTDTIETDTQWLIDSQFTRVTGAHNLKFGFEKRIFLNSFFQPDNTSGEFAFGPGIRPGRSPAANPIPRQRACVAVGRVRRSWIGRRHRPAARRQPLGGDGLLRAG